MQCEQSKNDCFVLGKRSNIYRGKRPSSENQKKLINPLKKQIFRKLAKSHRKYARTSECSLIKHV